MSMEKPLEHKQRQKLANPTNTPWCFREDLVRVARPFALAVANGGRFDVRREDDALPLFGA